MILFAVTFVKMLIIGSLLLTAIGAISLIVLLLRDRRGKNIW